MFLPNLNKNVLYKAKNGNSIEKLCLRFVVSVSFFAFLVVLKIPHEFGLVAACVYVRIKKT